MISLLTAVVAAALVVAWQLCADWWQRRTSRKRRRALEERFRRDARRYHRERFEGHMIEIMERGTAWYETADEQELMRSVGITFEDVVEAMRELHK